MANKEPDNYEYYLIKKGSGILLATSVNTRIRRITKDSIVEGYNSLTKEWIQVSKGKTSYLLNMNNKIKPIKKEKVAIIMLTGKFDEM